MKAAVRAQVGSPNSATFDGNGNVIAYVDMATGNRSATYEYGAFGETLIADGVAAEMMPFRFSTKFTDDETGLLYYGLRYYNSGTGRWLNRDPIEEDGGLNQYCFVANAALDRFDLLGQLLAYGQGADRAKITAAVGFLRQSRRFAQVWERLARDAKTTYEITTRPGRGGHDRRGKVVLLWFDPDSLVQFSDCRLVYPTWVLAHEVGHANDFLQLLVSRGAVDISRMRELARGDATEGYATDFANQVSAEIRNLSGLDMGYFNDYYEAQRDLGARELSGPVHP